MIIAAVRVERPTKEGKIGTTPEGKPNRRRVECTSIG
jgi:hypothetical protein